MLPVTHDYKTGLNDKIFGIGRKVVLSIWVQNALLNELHQTNVEILKRNQHCPEFGSRSSDIRQKPLETEIDQVSNPASVIVSPLDRNNAEHVPNERLQSFRDMQDWNSMLDMLDQAEYTNLVTNEACGFNGSAAQASIQSGSVGGNQAVNDHLKFRQTCEADDSKQQHQEGEQSEDTKVAAAKAAQQLDDLLFSLGQFKLEQQKRQQHPSPSADFDVHSAPTDSVDGTPAQTTSVDTNHTENNLSRGRTTNGKLQRQPARRIVALPNDMANDVNNDSSVQGPNHVLSSMMSDLSNELAQQGAITAPKGFCFACKKPIVGMLISAMDKYWHPDHFTCTNCGVGLVRANFYERDSQPYCTDCHARLFSPKCANCGEAILEKCIVALGRTWHPEHFFCNGCYRGFSGQVTVHEHENRVYCPACYLERFGTRCSGCNRTITDSYITALDVPWHRACFVCQDCGKSLSGSNFHEVDGYPFCEAHFYQRRGLLCYACSKPITGRCVNALGRRYHPEHFKCAYCLQTLQTGTFKEHSSKPYCHQCFAQLFG